MTIIQVGENWQFGSEFELEEVVWQNLPKLLNLKPFKRQYCVKGQFCDILALDEQQRLVVIELKNTEDRYVIQQLTRYYDALKEVAPFGPEIDVGHIRLIAIAPRFHQDTLIDCKYNLLRIELISFQLQSKAERFSFLLRDSCDQNIARCLLPKSPLAVETEIEVSEPPRKLLNWLSHASEAEFKAIIALRQQILGFDERMKEMIEPQRIVYGKGKSKLCCELRKMGQLGISGTEVAKFLWLPHPQKAQTLRMMVGTDKKEKNATGLLHYPIASRPKDLWQFSNLARWPGNSRSALKSYKLLLDSEMNCPLPKLIGFALKTWQARL